MRWGYYAIGIGAKEAKMVTKFNVFLRFFASLLYPSGFLRRLWGLYQG